LYLLEFNNGLYIGASKNGLKLEKYTGTRGCHTDQKEYMNIKIFFVHYEKE